MKKTTRIIEIVEEESTEPAKIVFVKEEEEKPKWGWKSWGFLAAMLVLALVSSSLIGFRRETFNIIGFTTQFVTGFGGGVLILLFVRKAWYAFRRHGLKAIRYVLTWFVIIFCLGSFLLTIVVHVICIFLKAFI